VVVDLCPATTMSGFELSVHDREQFAEVRSSIDATFEAAIGNPRSVAILHYPYDGNVGNHAMYLAIADHLHERGIRVAYAAHAGNFDVGALRGAIGGDPILFLGGVTMSRLWPDHAQTKRTVAQEFPRNRLVSLTSTMLFVDDGDAAAARGMFADHQDVVLLAREPESARQAAAVFGSQARILIEHDSVMRLRPISVSNRTSPTSDILWLRRDDLEATGEPQPHDVSTFDWPAMSDPMFRAAYVRMRACGAVSRVRRVRQGSTPRFVNRTMSALYRQVSREIVTAGSRLIASGRVLVTDRMHPHILSALMGQPVVLLPDRYGKNRSVFEHSTCRFSSVHWADTPVEALELARELARST
jgi:pyruvyl transferase EpsO